MRNRDEGKTRNEVTACAKLSAMCFLPAESDVHGFRRLEQVNLRRETRKVSMPHRGLSADSVTRIQLK